MQDAPAFKTIPHARFVMSETSEKLVYVDGFVPLTLARQMKALVDLHNRTEAGRVVSE